MTQQFRRYTGQAGYGPDYYELSGFLYRISGKEEKIGLLEWVFWEWQHARSRSALTVSIGIFVRRCSL